MGLRWTFEKPLPERNNRPQWVISIALQLQLFEMMTPLYWTRNSSNNTIWRHFIGKASASMYDVWSIICKDSETGLIFLYQQLSFYANLHLYCNGISDCHVCYFIDRCYDFVLWNFAWKFIFHYYFLRCNAYRYSWKLLYDMLYR